MRAIAVRSVLAAALACSSLILGTPADAAPPRTTVSSEAYAAGQPAPQLKHVYAGWDRSVLTATADATYPTVESRVRGTWEGTVTVDRDGRLMFVRRELSYTDPQPLAPSVETGLVIEYRWRNAWRSPERIESGGAVTVVGPEGARQEVQNVKALAPRSLAGSSVMVRVVSTARYGGGIIDLRDYLDVVPPGSGFGRRPFSSS